MSDFRIDKITNRDGSAGTQICGVTTFSGTSGIIMPGGPVEYRGGRGRGVIGGQGYSTYLNDIRYIEIATLGDAMDFGDMGVGRNGGAGAASATRGLFAGGYDNSAPSPYSNGAQTSIEYTTISSQGGAWHFGDLQYKNFGLTGCSDGITAVWMGGRPNDSWSSWPDSMMEYSTIASTGNSSTFGDLRDGVFYNETRAGMASPTRGIITAGANQSGGGSPYAGIENTIDYITIQTKGDTKEFGELAQSTFAAGGASSPTRGIVSGGTSPTGTGTGNRTDTIQYITIATLGNAIDFGNLLAASRLIDAVSSHTRAVMCGGNTGSDVNVIQYVTIATTGNAVDFGDMVNVGSNGCSLSDCHGGIV